MKTTDLPSRIDHTLLRPEATADQVRRLCEEAQKYELGAVCVAPARVALAVRELEGSKIKVAAVVGFPHGNTTSEVKAYEARQLADIGARELDMVIHIGALKERSLDAVEADIRAVVDAAGPEAIVKAILETALLTDEEKALGCGIAESAGAGFVKTSTGFASRGATVQDVALMRRAVGDRMGVKAAGGIRDLATAEAMIQAGADRLGCSSSVAIIEEWRRSRGRG